MTSDLLSAIQRKVAVSAIPPSAMRNQGAPGVAAVAREYLADLPLRRFAVRTPGAFARALDTATDGLCRALPRRASAWGTSRKAVNLFLRDAFYNKFLHEAFGLAVAEPFFELPLDGVVARALHESRGAERLSPWVGVKYLTRPQSAEYQTFAQEMAATKWGVARVHLDTFLWPAFGRSAPAR